MCLIIHKPQGLTVPADLIKSAWDDNPDGTGIMYRASDGLKVYKVMPKDWADPAGHIEKVLSELTDVEAGIHFRWKTHGPVSRENCHPFAIPGTGGYIMHNGVLNDKLLGPSYKQVQHIMSDTAFYTLTVLQDAPGAADPTFWDLVGNDVGSYNKMLLMDAAGQFLRVNPNQWAEYKGLHLSNLLSCDAGGWRKYYGTEAVGSDSYGYTSSANTRTSDAGDAVLVYTGTDNQPAKLTRRERKVLNACLRNGNWAAFKRLSRRGK
jgi:hypothetical protein